MKILQAETLRFSQKKQWATDEHHEIYKFNTGSILSDCDWIIETPENIILVEYKNGKVSEKSKFNPNDIKKIQSVAKKYYDTLHYLNLLGKEKTKQYYYILEFPNDDLIARKMIRDKIMRLLPFAMQKLLNTGIELINDFDVVSINEWNEKFPDYQITHT